jgi:hypothetical protein
MRARISFSCPACLARLQASIRLAGRLGACPGCGHKLAVPLRVPREEPPMLVADDGYTRTARDAQRN